LLIRCKPRSLPGVSPLPKRTVAPSGRVVVATDIGAGTPAGLARGQVGGLIADEREIIGEIGLDLHSRARWPLRAPFPVRRGLGESPRDTPSGECPCGQKPRRRRKSAGGCMIRRGIPYKTVDAPDPFPARVQRWPRPTDAPTAAPPGPPPALAR